MKKNKANELTTFDKFMLDQKQKEKFDKDYSKFLLKEFLLEAMDENRITVRKLAEQSGVSTSIIQNIRSEKNSNITFNTLSIIVIYCYYYLLLYDLLFVTI